MRTAFTTPEFLETLSLCLPADFLFPNLEILHWNPASDASIFHHVRWFLTSRIRDLSITCNSLSELLSSLASRCPSLAHVRVSTDLLALIVISATYNCCPALSTFVLALPQIESLHIPTLDDTALAHLAQMPDLKTLHIPYGQPGYTSQPYMGTPGFPNLAELTVMTMRCALRVISMAAKCPLVKLSITPSSLYPTETMARDFYHTLSEHCSHFSLREISMSGEFGVEEDNNNTLSADEAAEYSVGGDVLLPLFSFFNLVEVRLAHPVGFDFDDATILDMARAWPHLEALELTARPHRHIRSHVTLKGVYAFAKHCPHLHTLGLTFDATVVPSLRDHGAKRVAQTRLEFLNVAASLIAKSKICRVAKFLSAIFPHLMFIMTLNDDIIAGSLDEEDEPSQSVVDSSELWLDVQSALSTSPLLRNSSK
ncbi:hypothetical protein MVEN_00625700 [Mycena venus]|uniref:F-box domain-containing protein n=1 Tax=Mycena venus TaxID=2733690 RepID=A0A8H6YQ44_9AGAR|nr:hypothetical protein MVEN_00625700 [Mycena venus]